MMNQELFKSVVDERYHRRIREIEKMYAWYGWQNPNKVVHLHSMKAQVAQLAKDVACYFSRIGIRKQQALTEARDCC